MNYYVKASMYLLEDGVREGGYLHIVNGYFLKYVEEIVDGALVMDFEGSIISPGFVDTHIHGVAGHDVMDSTYESLNNISIMLLENGVTSFLPTTLTDYSEKIMKALKNIAHAKKRGVEGANIIGAFLEGPCFTEVYKGAQNSKYFIDPTIEMLEEWIVASEGTIKKIAMAPERKGAIACIHHAVKKNIHVAIGHTNANYEICQNAIQAGATIFVHTFNGMKGLHHREPGVVGAVLSTEHVYGEIIVDGHHVHPSVVNILYKCKGYDKTCLVSDCMRAGLLGDGTYNLGEFVVQVQDGIARTEAGSLAGSTLRFIDGVKNIEKWTNASLWECVHMGSLIPAKSIGVDNEIGSIAPGKRADFLILTEDLDLIGTVVGGEMKYKKNKERI
ncbi:N-acetylglucosamine-6-phosphate deacetylase [Bacillus cereus]|uniref:N-acetylglucosamine-6-phosphate deacetylase n=1 Tax=Bacillus paranthracis TaxID=2026186 RepID=UPI000943D10B|nr:N-acetylglucosamine-6-phosphate deacetylase [Bacillus paranthracis]OOZ78996.1 N-acetylglucosamine-6-phosphate deacetylase [Bacillus cereus]